MENFARLNRLTPEFLASLDATLNEIRKICSFPMESTDRASKRQYVSFADYRQALDRKWRQATRGV